MKNKPQAGYKRYVRTETKARVRARKRVRNLLT